jgi:hypothetical protein
MTLNDRMCGCFRLGYKRERSAREEPVAHILKSAWLKFTIKSPRGPLAQDFDYRKATAF